MGYERRYFGTDGVRGKVGSAPITPDFVMKLGWAAGRVLGKGGASRVLIGKDTRISGYMFESALEAGFSAAGVDILLLGPMPTPAIAYLTRTFRAQAGIVISASHNPYYDNGIKFFGGDGMKLPDAIESEIEAALDCPLTTVDSSRLGRAQRIVDAEGRYIEFCKSTFGTGPNLNGLKIVVDCAHGATYNIAPKVFDELGATVIAIGAAPNGLNINDQYGATKPEMLKAEVMSRGADVGIALDGDGDRVIMVDHQGEVVDGDELLFIIARERRQRNKLNGSVVGTQMSNLGLEHALRTLGLDLKRAKVGDRYVLEMMKEGGCTLGGESSGHIICLDMTTTGDGIVSALQVLETVVATGQSLNSLKSEMRKYPQKLINVRMARRMDVGNVPAVHHAVRYAEERLRDRGRVLLRPSGTEPLIRVMVEGPDEGEVNQVATTLAEVVAEALRNTEPGVAA
ncbi:MAG: phosphoglucosamine mutase [Gammaproteobacteria bacterium]